MRYSSRRSNILAVSTAIEVILLILATVKFLPAPGKSTASSNASPTAKATPAPTPNPLSIAAIQAYALTPSTITTKSSEPSRGGCSTSVVTFVADGYTEQALLQLPPTARPVAGYPVIILAHGYIAPASYSTTGTDYQSFMNSFCQSGYAIFKLDYRGNGQSGGEPTVGDLQAGYSYDLLDLTASLKSRSDLDTTRVAWLGHSMGGAVVLRAAVASHNLKVGAIILASGVVGSVDDTLNNWPTSMLPADISAQKQTFIQEYGTPASNPTFWHDISAINYVSNITAPVEINHGTADAVVPIAFSQHLDSALSAAAKPHVFYTYPGGDHQYTLANSRAEFISNTFSFLSLNLK